MYIHYNSPGMSILFVYVDDIIVTSANNEFISAFISYLHSRFEVKDLGELNYFLGIEVRRYGSQLQLSQTKYTLDLLKRANFLLAKPCSSPVATGSKLSLNDSTPLVDATAYRSVVGALQYLTITRPDLTYAVNQVCQFIHKPRQTHLTAVK